MTARQPSASCADRDALRSHGSMMTERDDCLIVALGALVSTAGVSTVVLRLRLTHSTAMLLDRHA